MVVGRGGGEVRLLLLPPQRTCQLPPDLFLATRSPCTPDLSTNTQLAHDPIPGWPCVLCCPPDRCTYHQVEQDDGRGTRTLRVEHEAGEGPAAELAQNRPPI